MTEEPVKVDFSYEQVDAWYKSQVTDVAWVYKSGDQIIALSPVCKHLGCMVDWNGDSAHQVNSSVHATQDVMRKTGKTLQVHRL